MKQERSGGAILFRGDEFLVLKYSLGHWGFPKGHVEEGEDDREAAIRETMEETGIEDLDFIPFEETIRYTYKAAGVLRNKTVVFFLAQTRTEEVKLSHEHKGFAWLPYEEALERVTYDDEKGVLRKAKKRIESHDKSLKDFF